MSGNNNDGGGGSSPSPEISSSSSGGGGSSNVVVEYVELDDFLMDQENEEINQINDGEDGRT